MSEIFQLLKCDMIDVGLTGKQKGRKSIEFQKKRIYVYGSHFAASQTIRNDKQSVILSVVFFHPIYNLSMSNGWF